MAILSTSTPVNKGDSTQLRTPRLKLVTRTPRLPPDVPKKVVAIHPLPVLDRKPAEMPKRALRHVPTYKYCHEHGQLVKVRLGPVYKRFGGK